jgi:8-oxo-dGTP pyrophosphatase MutT (NUDIX family)
MLRRNPWKTIDSRIAYENPWVRVREDRVIRPDGKPGIYGVIEVRPSIGVVAINDKDEIVLAGQWRYPLERYSWEIPRGGSEGAEAETMLEVARRELREEVGIEAAEWRGLGAVDACNGITTDVQHLFLATELRETEPSQEGVEEIIARWHPFREAVEMVLRGEITEVCSIAAILLVDRLRMEGALEAPLTSRG